MSAPGACGLVAALKAADTGAGVVVVERDAAPHGSTFMSSGFIPAPATRFQQKIGVDDDTSGRRHRCEIAWQGRDLSRETCQRNHRPGAGMAGRQPRPATDRAGGFPLSGQHHR
ncbi:MAG: FAD-binding protein [Nitratireductor sp.]|nr:FAD-binding protein [Nitratireductor sp.]